MPWPSGAVAASGPVKEKLPPILISASLMPWSGYLVPPACGAPGLQALPSSTAASTASRRRHIGRNDRGVRMRFPSVLKSSAYGAHNADNARRLEIDHYQNR